MLWLPFIDFDRLDSSLVETHDAIRIYSRRRGFSLVELLVVIALIGLLIALILPAIQASRESARKTQCRNNLKQIGLAFQNHVGVHGRFPSNGWGHLWIGNPNRGTDAAQPGGWIYNILPYLEHAPLRNRGVDLPEAQQRKALGELTQVQLAVLQCPSRPAGQTSPADPSWVPRNAPWRDRVAKSDYAANGGDFFIQASVWEGPMTLADGDAEWYPWADRGRLTGICFQRSEVRPAGVLDGLSNTYLVGEKHVSRDHYGAYGDEGYNESMYHGSSFDLTRWVLDPPRRDERAIDYFRFGSAHSAGCHFVFCDGSVRFVGYSVSREVHRRLGHRHDGETVDLDQ